MPRTDVVRNLEGSCADFASPPAALFAFNSVTQAHPPRRGYVRLRAVDCVGASSHCAMQKQHLLIRSVEGALRALLTDRVLSCPALLTRLQQPRRGAASARSGSALIFVCAAGGADCERQLRTRCCTPFTCACGRRGAGAAPSSQCPRAALCDLVLCGNRVAGPVGNGQPRLDTRLIPASTLNGSQNQAHHWNQH